MTFQLPPRPEGELREQVEKLYGCVFQLVQQMNLLQEDRKGGREAAAPAPDTGRQFRTLRSMVIKEADEARRERRGQAADFARLETNLQGETTELESAVSGCVDSINALGYKMAEDYMAISDFGTYLQKINAEIQADPEAVTRYYSFFSELKGNVDRISADFTAYKLGTEGYIRTGIVYYEDGLPVYGVAVGQHLSVHEADGETVIDPTNFRATYTARKLSFWQDTVEVAYVSNNRLYINNITVLQAVTLGRWEIAGTDGMTCKWIGG